MRRNRLWRRRRESLNRAKAEICAVEYICAADAASEPSRSAAPAVVRMKCRDALIATKRKVSERPGIWQLPTKRESESDRLDEHSEWQSRRSIR
jgi:hypothetical protein